ncbi:hypothetical protein A0J61_07969 [Choanephora cucurbitarum]|uniref:Uncharacterized protein n=1 Tax=Choanephora cucurbitarum TaxID=101091 RepID=A0A1C7N4D4_9FUNG|nr:hypothetical protein A0J61_07969 [Choanephora cucurbitarum]
MNVIDQQTSFQYDINKEILMKRLADASQYKIYPSIIPKNELPLRKILLTTRLWNHVRRQQALMTIPSSANGWLFQQQDNTIILEPEIKEQEDIPKNQYDWSWFDKEEKSSLSHEDTSSQDTSSFHNTTSKKRVLDQEDENEDKEQVQIKKIKLHFNTIDSPATPAGPDAVETTATTTHPAVLLSA